MGKHLVEHIVCLTDLTDASLPAFHHALSLALANRAQLTLLHIGPQHQDEVKWQAFPRVRETLARWGRLPADADQTRVASDLGIEVRKQSFRDTSLLQGLKAFLGQHHTDLVVSVASQGGRRWLGEPGVERLVAANMTHLLLIPPKAGFIDAETGGCRLQHTLMPVADRPHPNHAIRLCEQLLPALCQGRPTATLLHVGTRRTAPEVALDQGAVDWQWQFASGQVQSQIQAALTQHQASLLVMPSAGRPNLWQGLRRSHTEKTLRRLSQPVLAVASG